MLDVATFPYYLIESIVKRLPSPTSYTARRILFYLNCSFINSRPLPHFFPHRVSSLVNTFYLATFYSFDERPVPFQTSHEVVAMHFSKLNFAAKTIILSERYQNIPIPFFKTYIEAGY